MDYKLVDCEEHIDSEEEDYEIYFLQPASSPYNIKEKLDAANRALSEENPDLDSRPLRVKFKEEVDYEPDLTDDDVQSIESFNEVDFSIMEMSMETVPCHPPTKLEVNIFTPCLEATQEEDKDSSEEILEEEEDDLIEEEVKIRNNYNKIQFVEVLADDEAPQSNEEETLSSNDESLIDEDTSYREIEEPVDDSCKNISRDTTPSSRSSMRASLSSCKLKKVDIDCKTHCIEKIDATELKLTINKLQISEKPLCPALKLIQRKCCEKNHTKHEQRLPCYTGMRSEYGLSKAQLERRQKRKENSKIREEKRKKLIQEYKERKVQQNEEIFCQWLKTVEKRKQEQARLREGSKYCQKIVHFPQKPAIVTRPITQQHQVRPKTAPKACNVRKPKRPSTSPACVFIQVSPNMLKEGFRVGDLIFKETKGRKVASELEIVSLT